MSVANSKRRNSKVNSLLPKFGRNCYGVYVLKSSMCFGSLKLVSIAVVILFETTLT